MDLASAKAMIMLWRLSRNLKRKKILKEGARLLRGGHCEALSRLAEEHRNTPMFNPLQAMLARCHAEDDERDVALRTFNDLYASVKGASGGVDRHVKLFALYNLALIRNSLGDAAYLARKARESKPPAIMRAYLPIPLIEERPQPGPAVTSML